MNCLTIPVSVASRERIFSKLKLIKSYLRSTMSQQRLNGLALLSIEKDFLNEINYDNLIDNFTSQTTRKINFRKKYHNFNYFINLKKALFFYSF